MTDTMFAPLADAELAPPGDSGKHTESVWRPLLPAPVDCPPPHHPEHHYHGRASGVWTYRGTGGAVLFLACRFDKPDGEKEILPLTYGTLNCRDAWHWKAPTDPRPLYGLDRLAQRPEAPVIVCEGEKATDAAEFMFSDHVAVTSPSGAKAARKADWTPLHGRRVVVWPDHDPEGQAYAADVARLAREAGAAGVGVVQLPGEFPPKWDLADELPTAWTPEHLRGLLDAATSSAANEDAGDGHAISPFELRADGVWFRDSDPEKPDVYLCGRLEVVAETRADDGSNWASCCVGRITTAVNTNGRCRAPCWPATAPITAAGCSTAGCLSRQAERRAIC
jgi:hypothetical protein